MAYQGDLLTTECYMMSSKGRYLLPRVDECWDSLTGAVVCWTFKLILANMKDIRGQRKTCLVTSFGLYQFTILPFGIINSRSLE